MQPDSAHLHCGTVRDGGYTITGWHVDTADWCFAKGTGGVGYCATSTFKHVPDSYRGDMAAFTLSQVRKYNGGIVLFHDIHQNTANALDGIIRSMIDEGYTFTNLDDLDTFPRLNGRTPPFVGDGCTDDAQCAFDDTATCATNASGGFCTLPCEGYCPGFRQGIHVLREPRRRCEWLLRLEGQRPQRKLRARARHPRPVREPLRRSERRTRVDRHGVHPLMSTCR